MKEYYHRAGKMQMSQLYSKREINLSQETIGQYV